MLFYRMDKIIGKIFRATSLFQIIKMQSSILEILKKSLKTNQIWQCTSENLNLYKLEKKHFKSMKKMITATKM